MDVKVKSSYDLLTKGSFHGKKSMFQISFKFGMWKLHLILNSTKFVSSKLTN